MNPFDPPDGPRKRRLSPELLRLTPETSYDDLSRAFSRLSPGAAPIAAFETPDPVLEDTSARRAMMLGYADARKKAGNDIAEQARRNADAQAQMHLLEAFGTIPAQLVSGVNTTQNLGRSRDAAIQGALGAGNTEAEVRGRNRMVDAETALNVEGDRLAEIRENNRREDVAARERLANLRDVAAQQAALQQQNREADLFNQQQGRSEFFQDENLRMSRAAGARAAANAQYTRDRQARADALSLIDTYAKAGMLDRVPEEVFNATGYDRSVLEAAYQPDTSPPPGLSAFRQLFQPLSGQSTRGFWRPRTGGYDDAKAHVERIAPQAKKLGDDLREDLLGMTPQQRAIYGPLYTQALNVLGLAAGGDAEAAESAIEQFNDGYLALEGQYGIGGQQPAAQPEQQPMSPEELYRMADSVLAEGDSTASFDDRLRAAVEPEGEGRSLQSLEDRALALLESTEETDAAPATVEIPRDAVRVPLADLAQPGLYPPVLQKAIRRNGSLDGLRVVVLDENGVAVRFGDGVVLDNYAAISGGLARAREYARQERLERLNAEQAARMRSQASGSESTRSPGAYGSGGSR